MIDNGIDKYIPKVLKDNIDASGQALIDYVNDLIEDIKEECLGLAKLQTADEAPASLLDNLGYTYAAELSQKDTETQKRVKILLAVQGHKFRGTWSFDIKPKVDNESGLDATLFKNEDNRKRCWYGTGGEYKGYYWAGEFTAINGKTWFGNNEVELAGVVYIDIGSIIMIYTDSNAVIYTNSAGVIYNKASYASDYSAGFLQNIVNAIKNNIPAYFKVYIGFSNGSNKFTILQEVA